jgi:hypothetical protein
VEVPDGVAEVSIPIVLVTGSEAIAGAELEFSFSNGLEYVRYQPADGIENPVSNAQGGTQHLGFFSLDNRYVPTDERLSFGSLIFNYTGVEPQSISVTEIALHTRTGAGTNTEVVSQKTTNAVTIPVTRASVAGGSDSGADGATGDPSPSTLPAGGTQTPAVGSGAAAGETDAVELDADDGAGVSGSALASRGQAVNTAIPDADAPLSGGGLPGGSEQLPLVVGTVLIAAVIAAGVLYYVFSRKKERKGEEAQSQQQA